MNSRKLLMLGMTYVVTTLGTPQIDYAVTEENFGVRNSEILIGKTYSDLEAVGKLRRLEDLALDTESDEIINGNEGHSEIQNYIMSVYKELNLPEHISPEFVRAIIRVESSDDPYSVGSVGERGYMQIKEETWEQVRPDSDFYEDAFDPEENILTGVLYLDWLNENFERRCSYWDELSDSEKQEFLIAGYNAGINKFAMAYWNIDEMPETTKRYIEKMKIEQKNFEL